MTESKVLQQSKTISFDIFKISFIFLFFAFNFFLLINNRTGDVAISLSFFTNLLFIIVFSSLHIVSNKISLMDSVFLTFFYTFFWLAPVLQTKKEIYPNTMPVEPRLVVLTNFYLLVFGVSYFAFKNLFKIKIRTIRINEKYYKLNQKTFKIIFFLTIIIFILFFDYLITNMISASGISLSVETSWMLILNTFIFSFPLYLAYHSSLTIKNTNSKVFIFIISILLLLFFKNPLLTKRNALGPIYLTLFFIFFKEHFNNFKILLFLILVLSIIFPFSQAFTHNRSLVVGDLFETFVNRLKTMDVKQALTSLDYDAWSNFMAAIKYSEIESITYGRQLVGAVLFFVPRSFWPNKPVGSGHFVAENMLMTRYSFWFTNISMPFPAEGYINFGILGIILFAFILALISKITDKWYKYNDLRLFFSLYVCFHMVFMLRGDLMSSFAYLVGNLLAIFFVPLILNRITCRREKIES